MRIASFDIGKRNFSFCVEEVTPGDLKVKFPNARDRFLSDGTPSVKMHSCIDMVCSQGKIVVHENLDLTQNCDKRKKLDPETFHNFTDVLQKYEYVWDTCDVFVIEQQMSFGAVINLMAIKLAQHCYSFFQIRYGRTKEIIEFPAYHKTQVLGAPKHIHTTKTGKVSYKGMSKPQRKKWAVEKALELLSNREELESLTGIETASKRDDLADTFLQLQAYKLLYLTE